MKILEPSHIDFAISYSCGRRGRDVSAKCWALLSDQFGANIHTIHISND